MTTKKEHIETILEIIGKSGDTKYYEQLNKMRGDYVRTLAESMEQQRQPPKSAPRKVVTAITVEIGELVGSFLTNVHSIDWDTFWEKESALAKELFPQIDQYRKGK